MEYSGYDVLSTLSSVEKQAIGNKLGGAVGYEYSLIDLVNEYEGTI